MDRRTNPYAPGAGTPPPALVGREHVHQHAEVAINRLRNGQASKALRMVGQRCHGKTVLLNQMLLDADERGYECVLIEAPEDRSLPATLAGPLNSALIRLSRSVAAAQLARRARRSLAGFVRAMKVSYEDISVSLDLDGEEGVADSGDLDTDLTSLLAVAGEAARARGTVLALFIDELQYVEERQLGALITALHRAAQRRLPVTLIGSGLPQLVGHVGSAKSYAERMFSFPQIGPLTGEAARRALEAPAGRLGVTYSGEALDEILRITEGYPYFLQEWGSACWMIADGPVVTRSDVDAASPVAIDELDTTFFRVRFERTTPFERRYLRAMAELGPGPHRSGEVAQALARKVQSVAPTRSTLIRKGMIYSPAHGDTAFTVPLFDQYLKRVLPEWP
ncbi:MAG: ATP-binding protein [Gammaproteobacteria bacterium]|nr:ATP-binding protein [Gammaproteobacteria bacterium]